MIAVENHKKSRESILLEYPGSMIIDVTSHAQDEWVRLSPMYPHGGIPVPFSPDYTSDTVEGIWQGLKVFEHEGASPKVMHIMSMTGIKRAGKSLGNCIGHQKGLESKELLGYIEARKQIYIPTYEWVLENRCAALVERLRVYSSNGIVVLLDYDTNTDVENTKKPLSHASIIIRYIVARLSQEEKENWKRQAEENETRSKEAKQKFKIEQKRQAEEAAAREAERRAQHDKEMLLGNPSKYTPIWVKEQIQKGEKVWFLTFWKHIAPAGKITNACLCQWYPCTFVVDGISYNCTEQYMMAEKARIFGDEDTRMKILSESDPGAIKALGREAKGFDAEKWCEVKFDVVVKGNLAKFGQNAALRTYLLSTKSRVLVEASPFDKIWGVGLKEGMSEISDPDQWKGSNLLGFALMVVRDKLSEEFTSEDV